MQFHSDCIMHDDVIAYIIYHIFNSLLLLKSLTTYQKNSAVHIHHRQVLLAIVIHYLSSRMAQPQIH